MENRNNRWYIDDESGCPDWILNLESGISQIILDNLSG